MLNVSSEFKRAVADGLRNYIVEADIKLADKDSTVLNITNEDIWNGGFSFSEATSSENSFDIGATVMGSMTLVLNNIYDKFSGYNFYDATLEVRFGLDLESGREMIRKGFYTVEKPTYNGSLITLQCIDNMWKFEKDFKDVKNVSAPITIGNLVANICAECGVELSNPTFNNSEYVIEYIPEEEMNCREAIGYLAQMCCCYAKINSNGSLKFDWYQYDKSLYGESLDGGIFDHYSPYQSGDEADGGNFIDWTSGDDFDGGNFAIFNKYYHINGINSLNVSTDYLIVNGIKIAYGTDDEKTFYQYGGNNSLIIIDKNPFFNEERVAIDIALVISLGTFNLPYRKYNVSAQSAPYVEAGDICIISDSKNHNFLSVITGIEYTIGQREKFVCGGKEPERGLNVHYSEADKNNIELRRKIKREVSDKITQIDLAVKNMTELAVNSMGYFQTVEEQEDGSIITYLHNKPLLSESVTVYKMSADGFFISQDGGETYMAGFDSEGNSILNILSTIGIQFEWARGGTLSLGGYDNKNGELFIYNKDGDLNGKINNNGISLWSDTTGIQLILSPLIGFVQRDINGNEFYGLFHEEVVSDFPTSLPIDEADDSHLLCCKTTVYEAYDVDTHHFENYRTEENVGEVYIEPTTIMGVYIPGVFYPGHTVWYYRSYYTHDYFGWTPHTTINSISNYNVYTKKRVSLPQIYKNKPWVIESAVSYDNFKVANFVRHKFEELTYYVDAKPYCKADGKVWYGESSFVNTFPTTNEPSDYKGIPSPYYYIPTKERIYTDITKNIEDYIKENPRAIQVTHNVVGFSSDCELEVSVKATIRVGQYVIPCNECVAIKVTVVC